MIELAPGVHALAGFPRYAISMYLIDGVLIDAATRHSLGRILREIKGRKLLAHALTHAHPDHQGASHALCERLGLPLWCGAADADAMARGATRELIPANPVALLVGALFAGPGHPVSRRLAEGDPVGSFEAIETPGHTPGHVAFWRARDRVLIIGDALANHPGGLPIGAKLSEPPTVFTVDVAQNRRSLRKLRDLNPALVAFGHGPPLRDPGAFREFIDRLA
ncbi:MAG TPA: MBL fold metallo-hydrolase [Herpetosiphonaceae bacterium]